jgi:hypothetical protein
MVPSLLAGEVGQLRESIEDVDELGALEQAERPALINAVPRMGVTARLTSPD